MLEYLLNLFALCQGEGEIIEIGFVLALFDAYFEAARVLQHQIAHRIAGRRRQVDQKIGRDCVELLLPGGRGDLPRA